jgi:hypothetical protein
MSRTANFEVQGSVYSVQKKTVSHRISSITKGAVINAFSGLHFDRDQWNTYLADSPKWLKRCRVKKGNKRISATWNPVLIALALLAKGVSINKLDAVFIDLNDWAEDWKKETALFRD